MPRPLNPTSRAARRKEHIIVSRGKDHFAIRIRKGDEMLGVLFLTKEEMEQIIAIYTDEIKPKLPDNHERRAW